MAKKPGCTGCLGVLTVIANRSHRHYAERPDRAEPLDISELPHGLTMILGDQSDVEAYDASRGGPKRAD